MLSTCSLKKRLSLSLAILLAMSTVPAHGGRRAGGGLRNRDSEAKQQVQKFAPDLEELLALDDERPGRPPTAKTLAERRHEKLERGARLRVGGRLLPSPEVRAEENQSFIVQLNDTASGSAMNAKLAAFGGQVTRKMGGGLFTIEVPRTAIRQLAADGEIGYVSPDRPVAAAGHLESTTGASLVRNLVSGTTLNGANIGVAVIDSGMDQFHSLFKQPSGLTNLQVRQDFTGKNFFDDPYGHGTHVSSIIVGSPSLRSGNYTGIAPSARIISLGVLDDQGYGTASNVITAIDWCINNKSNFNIRILNLSLGTPAKDSYKNDPLCQAVRRAYNAGIVVVVAAGNNGKDSSGRKIYGGINSPGIEPSAITVGAANTYGTDARSDDVIASYSSRGPTRGYVTVNGQKKYDNLIKPDLVAPGNKIIAACSNGKTGGGNNIEINYPALKTGTASTAADQVMYQSGTSMATPVVSGAVALMLQANPNLTPSLVKAILMYTAQPLNGFNMFEQGAGELNVDGAVRTARLVKTTLPTTVGSALLTSSLPSQQSTIAGYTFRWGQGAITNWGFLYGSDLMKYWQSVYGSGVVLADATVVSGGSLVKVSGRTSSGVSLKSGAVSISGSGVVLADGVVMADGVMLSDGVMLADGVVMADGVMLADGVVLADGTTRADTSLRSSSNGVVTGDNTSGMTAP